MKISSKRTKEVLSLISLITDHLEADTKICYLTHHTLSENGGNLTVCAVLSSSGDTDIPMIWLANEYENLKINYLGVMRVGSFLTLVTVNLPNFRKGHYLVFMLFQEMIIFLLSSE